MNLLLHQFKVHSKFQTVRQGRQEQRVESVVGNELLMKMQVPVRYQGNGHVDIVELWVITVQGVI
jgi:hypothetical protein